MADLITPRAKRLLMISPLLLLSVYFVAPLLNPQRGHIMAVNDHIAAISEQWSRFRAENPGFQDVELGFYSGSNGFGVNGVLDTEEQSVQLRKFIESTNPPRPIKWNVRVYVEWPEPVGPANRSQPVQPETNTTLLPAGSGR
jgi:hypothetical protein